MKKVAIVLSVLLILLVLAEVSAPRLIARGLELGLRRTLGTDVEIKLDAYPSLRLLLGHFEELSVVARGVNLGGLTVEEYTLAAEQVTVNLRELLARRELRFVNQGRLTVQVTVAEGELSSFLREKMPALKDWRVQINAGNAVVIGKIPLQAFDLDVRVHGKFQALGKEKIAFVPERAEVQGVELPAALVQALLQDAQFYIDLKAAPMPLELIDVKMEPGRLIVRARVLD
ncbi:MAG: DUF2993 domain-containing protein [Selenomonadales bacterium]|nr:DUF2993 domain-containing protein [Selenomonadales bacterium]